MTAPEQPEIKTYVDLTTEVSSQYERLVHARGNDDPITVFRAERDMNSSLEQLGDVIRALGHVSL